MKGKTAIVTASTSGIGLGIARHLAGAGARLMLNGFGDPTEIERLRVKPVQEFGVKFAYSGATMSKPAQIHTMAKTAEEDLGSVGISEKKQQRTSER